MLATGNIERVVCGQKLGTLVAPKHYEWPTE
jgi:hypothetical protein